MHMGCKKANSVWFPTGTPKGIAASWGQEDGTRGDGLRLDIREDVLLPLSCRGWERDAQGVGGSPSLEVVRNSADVALGDTGHAWWGWAGVGLGDLGGLFQP